MAAVARSPHILGTVTPVSQTVRALSDLTQIVCNLGHAAHAIFSLLFSSRLSLPIWNFETYCGDILLLDEVLHSNISRHIRVIKTLSESDIVLGKNRRALLLVQKKTP